VCGQKFSVPPRRDYSDFENLIAYSSGFLFCNENFFLHTRAVAALAAIVGTFKQIKSKTER